MKPEWDRRRFLRFASNGIGSLLLGRLLSACRSLPEKTTAADWTPSASFTAPAAAAASPSPALPSPSAPPDPTSTAFAPPDMAVAHGGDDPAELVLRAIGALGGMSRFVPSGSKVLIKPNICSGDRTYEQAATTNPWVVAALVRLCREAGAAQVHVLDYPFYRSSREAYDKSGIREPVEAAGGEMILTSTYTTNSEGEYRWIDYGNWVDVDLPDSKRLKSIQVIDEAVNADVLINVPIAKTHDLTRLTLGIKNLMGLIHNRPAMHTWIAEKLPDLVRFFRPALTVVDAVRILAAHGPRGAFSSDVKKIDTVIASPDIVAADSYATSLFGLTPADIEHIVQVAAAGLGNSDLGSLRIDKIELGG